MIRLIESPREGLQGLPGVVSTEMKIGFINTVLRAGFDMVEIGSMVNPKVIPQMADTLAVIRGIDYTGPVSERMVLVMSRRGAEMVAPLEEVNALSYPFSFSPTFLMRNVRSTVEEVFDTTRGVIDLCERYGKKAVIYISYAYGNPFGDPWSLDLLMEWIAKLTDAGAKVIPLSNVSVEIEPDIIFGTFSSLTREFPDTEFGLHLHHGRGDWHAKVEAAYQAGCRRFDTVLSGAGGCPLSGHDMMGNLDSPELVAFFEQQRIPHRINLQILKEAVRQAQSIYPEKTISLNINHES